MTSRLQIVERPAEPHPGRPSRYDPLFDSIRIGPKVMKNRFYATPHSAGLGYLRPRGQAAFRGMKAAGGWAVVNTEYCSISPETDDSPEIPSRLWDDDDIPALRLMTDAVHEHDALAGIELWYGGSVGTALESRLTSRGVSQVVSDQFFGHSAIAMTPAEIRDLQQTYVTAARRAVSAGFDIIILGAQEVDNIFMQFLMPFYNRRTDAYGGPIENRARFLLETAELVREAVGDHAATTVRLCVDTFDATPGGMRAEVEGAQVVGLADHLVDYWDVQAGGWDSRLWGDDTVSARFSEENFQGEHIRAVRAATDKPLVGVGRFTSADAMVDAVTRGQQDLIGGARASISDPFLPTKIREGRFDDIRECIGCNICVSRVSQSTPIICTQNPTAGEEHRRGWHPEAIPLVTDREPPVLVVGAGPAGLECAVTLGRRGFETVHLVDAGDAAGGALRWMSLLPGLASWIRVVDYRALQLPQLPNVELILNTRLEVADILDYGAEIVIAATGSHWSPTGLNWATHREIPGAEAGIPHVLTPEQVVAGVPVPGHRVVVYDADGYAIGPSIAQQLVADGHEVVIITPYADVAPIMEHTFEADPQRRRLEELGIETLASTVITQIDEGSVQVGPLTYREQTETFACDAVVLVTQRESDDATFRTLEADPDALAAAGIRQLLRIGDCVVPRLVADATFDGHRLGREIDQPRPAIPLSFLRERPAF